MKQSFSQLQSHVPPFGDSIAHYYPHDTNVRFHPNPFRNPVAVAPPVNFEFAVLVKMSFVNS
jgi:hypothetical protein